MNTLKSSLVILAALAAITFDSRGQTTRVTGQWDFDGGDLKATVGRDLEYGDGPGAFMAARTRFGGAQEFGIPVINGTEKVMGYFRSEHPPGNYVAGYAMRHGIAPNGGGAKVNQWTLIIDILFPDLHLGDQYSALIEIQNRADSDADLFVHEESTGVGGIGISGQYAGRLTAGQWHRVVLAVDLAATPPVISKFIDGVKAADQTVAEGIGLDGRFALEEIAHLFSDGGQDNEVNTYFVNSVQIRDGKLSDDGVAALGGPQATGIPDTGSPPVTSQPKLSATRRASQLTFAWDAGVTGFILQATDNLANPNWQAVSGVNSNSISITVGVRAQFYRLKQSP